jgi:hypothetical protein
MHQALVTTLGDDADGPEVRFAHDPALSAKAGADVYVASVRRGA